jgi:hypothetical protein
MASVTSVTTIGWGESITAAWAAGRDSGWDGWAAQNSRILASTAGSTWAKWRTTTPASKKWMEQKSATRGTAWRAAAGTVLR